MTACFICDTDLGHPTLLTKWPGRGLVHTGCLQRLVGLEDARLRLLLNRMADEVVPLSEAREVMGSFR